MIKIKENSIKVGLIGPYSEIQALVEEMKYRPDDFWRSPAYQKFKLSKGQRGWDGFDRPLAIKSKRNGEYLAVALRGHLPIILEHADKLAIEINKDQMLERPFAGMTIDDVADDLIVADFKLDDDQRACILGWVQNMICINQMSVSAGKTATFCGAARLIKNNYPDARFLYFANTERLIKQVVAESRKFLPDFDISQFGGGTKSFEGRDMVVATGASLNLNFNAIKSELGSFMAILADESHRVTSNSYKQVMMACPAPFRFGASDSTREHIKKKNAELTGLLGPVLNRVKAEKLIKAERVAVPHFYVVNDKSWDMLELPYQADEDTPAWAFINDQWLKGTYKGKSYKRDKKAEDGVKRDRHGNPIYVDGSNRILLENGAEIDAESRWCLLERAYDKRIIRYKKRNELIKAWASYFVERNMPTLVVCTRTLHILLLEKLLGDAVGSDKVMGLWAEHSSAERDEVFKWFKNASQAILITPLIKEGVSINEIRGMIVADYVADFEVANQLVGRAIRKKQGDNEAHIVWFVENQHSTFRRGSRRVIKKLRGYGGYQFHECCHPDDIGLVA